MCTHTQTLPWMTMAAMIKFLTPMLPRVVRCDISMSCDGGRALSPATGQISASSARTSNQSSRLNFTHFQTNLNTLSDFQLSAEHWPAAFHLFSLPNSALLSDVQGPEANVSPTCNYPPPYAVWEEWKGLTSFWPSAALRFLSHPSLSPASPISYSSLRGLSVLVSVFVSSVCKRSLVCNVCMLSVCLLQLFHPVISFSAGFFLRLVTKRRCVSPFDCKSLPRL